MTDIFDLIAQHDCAAIVSAPVDWLDAEIERRNASGLTPVMLAASLGDASIVDVLVKNGADLTACDPDGQTAATYVARLGNGLLKTMVRVDLSRAVARAHLENALSGLDVAPVAATREDDNVL